MKQNYVHTHCIRCIHKWNLHLKYSSCNKVGHIPFRKPKLSSKRAHQCLYSKVIPIKLSKSPQLNWSWSINWYWLYQYICNVLFRFVFEKQRQWLFQPHFSLCPYVCYNQVWHNTAVRQQTSYHQLSWNGQAGCLPSNNAARGAQCHKAKLPHGGFEGLIHLWMQQCGKTVNFVQNIQNRYPMSHPHGWVMGYQMWV